MVYYSSNINAQVKISRCIKLWVRELTVNKLHWTVVPVENIWGEIEYILGLLEILHSRVEAFTAV